MNIQKTNNTNFEARRILNVRKAVQNGADEIIDVFALGKEDKKFVAKCYDTLRSSNRVLRNNPKNIKRSPDSADTSFKNFFKSFMEHLSGRNRDCMSFDDMTYLVAVKDGEVITGVAELSDDYYPLSRIERLIFTQKDSLVENSLIYGIMTKLRKELKERPNAAILGLGNNLLPKIRDFALLPLDKFHSAQSYLRTQIPNTKFVKVKDLHEYDMEEFLGIKDIETEVMI